MAFVNFYSPVLAAFAWPQLLRISYTAAFESRAGFRLYLQRRSFCELGAGAASESAAVGYEPTELPHTLPGNKRIETGKVY